MSERDILLRWLAGAAARLRIARRLRDAGMLGCALFGLLALHRVLGALVPVPPLLAALQPFLVFTALAGCGWFAWRLSRRVTLAEAAAAADRRAGLKDEMKSAYWLGERIEARRRAALLPLLMRRAAGDAQRLDPSRLFPLRLPSSVAAAFGLALIASALGWLPARIAHPTADARAAADAPPAQRARADSGVRSPREAPRDAAALPVAERDRAAWSALDKLAADLRGGPEAGELKRALAARDAGRARSILAAMQRRETAAALPGASARPEGEQMSAQLAQGILERLQSLLQAAGDTVPEARSDRPAPAQHTAHLTEQLREEVDEAQRDNGGRHSQGETHLNDMLRAISRSSVGERQAVPGDGDLAEDHGRTSLGGGAMGRRLGVSRAGGGDGERPQGDPDGDAESEAVLGAPTERLQMQLRKVHAEGGDDGQSEAGSEEDFYAATRAQAAQLDYRTIEARRSAASESVVAAEHTPLAYRDAVKRFSMMQHRRER